MKRVHLDAETSAPQFTVQDVLGKTIRLASYADKFVLLVFLRYAGCPWCNLTIHRLTAEYPMLKKNGCEVIAFMQSSSENIQKNIYDRHTVKPPFPIIADLERNYYDQYGVTASVAAAAKSVVALPYWLQSVMKLGFKQTEIDGNLLLVPAHFLVGPGEQKIVIAEYGSSFYDHMTFTDIYEPLTFIH